MRAFEIDAQLAESRPSSFFYMKATLTHLVAVGLGPMRPFTNSLEIRNREQFGGNLDLNHVWSFI